MWIMNKKQVEGKTYSNFLTLKMTDNSRNLPEETMSNYNTKDYMIKP